MPKNVHPVMAKTYKDRPKTGDNVCRTEGGRPIHPVRHAGVCKKLSDAEIWEIWAVLSYIKSRWPEAVQQRHDDMIVLVGYERENLSILGKQINLLLLLVFC